MTARTSIRLYNRTARQIRFSLEPWGDLFVVDNDVELNALITGPPSGVVSVYFDRDAVSVFEYYNCKVRIVIADEVMMDRQANPNLTLAQSELTPTDIERYQSSKDERRRVFGNEESTNPFLLVGKGMVNSPDVVAGNRSILGSEYRRSLIRIVDSSAIVSFVFELREDEVRLTTHPDVKLSFWGSSSDGGVDFDYAFSDPTW